MPGYTGPKKPQTKAPKKKKKKNVMARKQRRVPKDKATGLPKKYLSGAKNRSAKPVRLSEPPRLTSAAKKSTLTL